jgi:O-acetyl-ADP-ribose deacetylase (regulator of RNase III)
MSFVERQGNLFASDAQALVNTVNCVGVMGKGVALEFRRRFPEMFEVYRRVCAANLLRPGHILPYRRGRPWILNFAIKDHWKQPSRLEWVDGCLQKFTANYRTLGITSVALPWLGAMNGRLDRAKVLDLMRTHLRPLADVVVEVIEFDPYAADPLFDRLRQAVRSTDAATVARQVGIKSREAALVCKALWEDMVPNLTELCNYPGLGDKTLERLYACFRTATPAATESAPTLFDEH